MKTPQDVLNRMMKKDRFSDWLKLDVKSIEEGKSLVEMIVREDMLNGFDVLHGGVTFALADSAFAFACNSRNNLTLALDAQISFMKKVVTGDVLTASVEELHNGKSTGVYEVKITNQKNETVAAFRGTAYRTGKELV
ncbi:MAG: hydroxyphenylacetyl-CoA thioesterase PaaI [Bacteriovoracaceae bacterium]|nr:hydroxyphenylacetyl-CoA thioesterase PaaI [Bacteriovoracaceae bacterium]